MKFQDLKTNDTIQCALVLFADDAGTVTDRKNAVELMQLIIDTCNKLYSARGGCIED